MVWPGPASPSSTPQSKPVVVALMGERMIQEAVEYFRAARVPDYRFPERAAAALAVLADRADFVRQQTASPAENQPHSERPEGIDATRAVRILNDASDAATLSADAVSDLLQAYGVRVPQSALATSAEQAVTIAEAIGYPVALKVASAAISHKSDIGGVLLALADPTAVTDGYTQIVDNARAALPDVPLEGGLGPADDPCRTGSHCWRCSGCAVWGIDHGRFRGRGGRRVGRCRLCPGSAVG